MPVIVAPSPWIRMIDTDAVDLCGSPRSQRLRNAGMLCAPQMRSGVNQAGISA
jgi:hypothetical protein